MTFLHKCCLALGTLLALTAGSLRAERFSASEMLAHFDIEPAEGITMTTIQYEGEEVIEFSGLYGEINITSRDTYRYISSGSIALCSDNPKSGTSYYMGATVHDLEYGDHGSVGGRKRIATEWTDYTFDFSDLWSGTVSIQLIKGSGDVLRLRAISIVCAGQASLWFEPETVTIEAGKEADMPTVKGNSSGYTPTYTSSDPAVVSIDDYASTLQAHKPGTATIYATIPEKPSFPGAKGEFQVTVTPYALTGTSVTLTMPRAGALRELLADLPGDKIGSLTLTGPINSQDIIVLRGENPRLTNLQRLDLSQATLDPDEGEYASTSKRHDIGMGSTTIHYFLSADERDTRSSSSTGLGGGTVTIKRYTLDLSGAFNGLDHLTELILPNDLQRLGNNLATGCPELQIVTGPAHITVVEEKALANCPKLHTLNAGQPTEIGAHAFYQTLISELDLSNVTKLGTGAFRESGITAANLSALDTIPDDAFRSATRLAQLTLNPNTVAIGEMAFQSTALSGVMQLPASVHTLGSYAFAGTDITDITGPTTLLHAGHDIFGSTPMAQRLQYDEPTDVVYIGNCAVTFYENNHSGNELTIREGTVALAQWLFRYAQNSNLRLTLPPSLRVVGDYALAVKATGNLPASIEWYGEQAVSLNNSELTLGENVTHISSTAFSDMPSLLTLTYNTPFVYDGYFSPFPGTMEKVTIGPKARQIASYMLSRKTNLIRLNFEKRTDKSPLTIGEQAFSGSTRITTAQLPEGTDTIAAYAFGGCTALREAYIPSTTKYIAMDAFQQCPNLKAIYNYQAEPYLFEPKSRADSYVFPADATIYVLPGAVEAYKASAQWGQWNIEPMDEAHLGDFDTGVAGVPADPNDPATAIYSLDGRKVSANPPSGTYIVRHRSGKTYKVVR